MTTAPHSKVYLVGAGPGAVDLITVRGAKLLSQAQIVFFDALIDPEMLTLCPQAIQIQVGKRCGKLSTAQKFIEKRMMDAAEKYQHIVRLKGGDPMIFGRADEELQALKKAGIDVEVVPGVTSALAAAASIENSLTLRGVSRSVAFVTMVRAQEESGSPSQVVPNADTLIYYMGKRDAVQIASQLIQSGRDVSTPVVIVESISTSRERSLRLILGELVDGLATSWFTDDAPAILMIGQALYARTWQTEVLPIFTGKINDRFEDQIIFSDGLRSA